MIDEPGKIASEQVAAELTAFCAMLYARTLVLFDLLQEAGVVVDKERFGALIRQRNRTLAEELEADKWGDRKMFAVFISELREKYPNDQ